MYNGAACLLGWCKDREKRACHLEGSRASSVRGDILIKHIHCVSFVLLSGVYERRGFVLPYVIIIIIIKIHSCHSRKALRSLGSKGKPDFGEYLDSPGAARLRGSFG